MATSDAQQSSMEGMVRVQWVGGPVGAMECIGAKTRKNYGRRRQNDVFWVMEEDFRAMRDQFVEVHVGAGVTQTGDPADPTLVSGATAPAPKGNQASAEGFAKELDKLSPDDQQSIIQEAMMPADYVGAVYPSDPTPDDLHSMAEAYQVDTFDVPDDQLRDRINAQLTARYTVGGETAPEEFASVQPGEPGEANTAVLPIGKSEAEAEPTASDGTPIETTLQTEGMVLGKDWPDTTWTKANIQTFADDHAVDLKGASTQAAMLKNLGPMRKV